MPKFLTSSTSRFFQLFPVIQMPKTKTPKQQRFWLGGAWFRSRPRRVITNSRSKEMRNAMCETEGLKPLTGRHSPAGFNTRIAAFCLKSFTYRSSCLSLASSYKPETGVSWSSL